MRIIEDTIEGMYAEVTSQATRYERRFLVTEVPRGSQLTTVLGDGRIPKRGDLYPGDPSALVESVQVAPVSKEDNTAFSVLVRYSTDTGSTSSGLSLSDPDETRYEVRTITERTIFDRNGQKMSTNYITSLSTSLSGSRVSVITAHLVEVQRPGVVISISRTTTEDPGSLNRKYGGTVNNDTWSVYGRYQVLCEGFEGQGARDGTGLWRTTGRFYPSPLRDRTWKTQVFARGSNNLFPTDASLGRGIEQYEPYPVSNFGQSGFYP